MMLRNTVSTMTSECFLVRSETRETSSTSSAFVMLPLVMASPLVVAGSQLSAASCSKLEAGSWFSLLVLEMIAERHFRSSGRLRIRFPVAVELIALQRPDAQPDLPLRGDQFDDLHLVALANLQFE